jgi:hypothetical protein
VLIAALSIIVALASYHSAIAGSEETKHNMISIQAMTDANGEYVSPTSSLSMTTPCTIAGTHPTWAQTKKNTT